MDWEHKLQAIQALVGGVIAAPVLMRSPGNWYVSMSKVSIGGDGYSTSVCGDGHTPEDAVCDAFGNLTSNVKKGDFVIVDFKRWYRWNGFMWQEFEKPKVEAAT